MEREVATARAALVILREFDSHDEWTEVQDVDFDESQGHVSIAIGNIGRDCKANPCRMTGVYKNVVGG